MAVLWDTPDHMNRFPLMISLQKQNARSFEIIRIFFYNDRIFDAENQFSNCQAVFRKLVIAVLGQTHAAGADEILNRLEKIRQRWAPIEIFLL